ncbi:hypothetical protein DOTSEDRAFT_68176 [Dothistroma septosporum NZE10]|uniref:Exocyst complex component Sec3 PIP2-binding N-terminal domain-containing protein n=1 Tax=Dothistroma septosporum (strain NZE10 / CBS 128990) TaxID=675120 RepID=N1Q238_DOTSN|nr:hypothetical protein DOTSEDRAFT_68176 [Dothistroma septosporum NZE10]
MSRPPNSHPGYARNGDSSSNNYTSSNGNVGSMPTAMSSNARLQTPPTSNQRPHSPASSQQGPPSASMSRAERFEDEKRRIIESCFSKLDTHGQLAESYITHIRITEDAQYPSAPPPADSLESNKKPRLIVIAVRSTGRVRMHKARENNNGSFSIGKTWNMEELSAIESYSNPAAPAANEREAHARASAGSVGFTVTITKPYYWQAGTSKEKDFFIASAVKIYRKYTKGQIPELKGFEDREKAMIIGSFPGQQGQPSSGQQAIPPSQQGGPPGGRQPSHSPAPAPPQPPFAARDHSREESRYRQSPGPPPSISDARPGSGPNSRRPSDQPQGRGGPSQQHAGVLAPGGPRAFASSEQMRSRSRDDRDAATSQLRPGTSPAPGSEHRAPSFASTHRSDDMPPHSPMRTKSPRLPGPGIAPPPLKPQSPPRQRDMQHIEGASEERQPKDIAALSGQSSGADLFREARQRYMNYQPGSSPDPSSQARLPSIETSHPQRPAQNGRLKTLVEKGPPTAQSESSDDINVDDAAALGALTSYWGPEHAKAAPSPAVTGSEGFPTPNSAQLEDPATPQRSHFRPAADLEPERKGSEASMDLRPAPLNAARSAREIAAQAIGSELVETSSQMTGAMRLETKTTRPTAFGISQLRGETPEPSPAQTPDEEKMEEEHYRPGLGPMFKKKAIADRFRKAANASNAFKPRPGGAAEAILRAKAERDGGPDGITGVVPRPATREKQIQADQPPASSIIDRAPEQDFALKRPQEDFPSVPPTVEVSSPQIPARDKPTAMNSRQSVELFDTTEHLQSTLESESAVNVVEERQIGQPQVKIKRRSAQQEKYLSMLGVDRSLLDGKGLEFEVLLSEFGWHTGVLQPRQLAALENDVRREQGRVEAGSWLSHTDAAREERVAHVESLLDKAIAECDELEGLLTLYHVELSSLNDDIAFIEAQSQGLQVQSANQKLLQSELQGLVDTMSLDRNTMEPLRYGDLADARGLGQVENSLVKLYQAMLTMDPTMGKNAHGRPRSRGGIDDNETSNMTALREKKVTYDRETSEFCKRLMQFLDSKFAMITDSVKSRMLQTPRAGGLARLNSDAVSEVRNGLWMYSPLILFTKEVSTPAWQTLQRMYYTRAAVLYTEAFKENISNMKRAARASTGDETDILFTAQEKEEHPAGGGLASTARKITVKRSQTLAKTLRNPLGGDKAHAPERKQPGTMSRSEAFALAMDDMAPKISEEQNFFVDLFHANSTEAQDFIDAVSSAAPGARRGTDLRRPKPTDPERHLAGLVTSTMGEIFSFFGREVDAMLNWSISEDPIQGIGVMASLSKHAFYLRESNQEYLQHLVNELFDKLQTRFNKFVDEQIRAIEDTKVKIKKRKGIIAFMKIFPQFSNYVENSFATVAGSDYDGPADCVLDVRRLVDVAYDNLNRAMFDSLKVIAKESPAAGIPAKGTAQGTDDPEDKEMLNYHILLIENMNHYIEEVEDGGRQGVLAKWKKKAQDERADALGGYVQRVIRRPLGKLLDFLESTESILGSNNNNPTAVSSRPSYSRKTLRHLLSERYDGKTVRRDIDTLRKRIEKHFGDAEDSEAVSRNLVGFVSQECEKEYERVLDRTESLKQQVYPDMEGEKEVIIDFSKADISAAFRR